MKIFTKFSISFKKIKTIHNTGYSKQLAYTLTTATLIKPGHMNSFIIRNFYGCVIMCLMSIIQENLFMVPWSYFMNSVFRTYSINCIYYSGFFYCVF